MRTTLNLEDDVLSLGRSLAQARKISLGEAVSYLARRGATAQPSFEFKNGFPVFIVSPGTPPFGPEEIERAQEEDDRAYGKYFLKPNG